MEFSLSIILIYLNSKWPICCRNIMVSACEPIPKRCFLRWVGVKRNSRRKSTPAKQWTNQLHRENLWCLTLPVRKLWSLDGKVSAWGLFKRYKQSYSSKTDERHFFLALIQDLFQICPTCGRVCLSSIGLISHKKNHSLPKAADDSALFLSISVDDIPTLSAIESATLSVLT